MTGSETAECDPRSEIRVAEPTSSPRALTPLSAARVAQLPPDVRRPGFDVERLGVGVLHLGCGAFHRGHQALMTQQAIEAECATRSRLADPPRWGIAAAALRTPHIVDALAGQDGLFTVLERDRRSTTPHLVATVREPLFAPRDARALEKRLAGADVPIITLTVTEAGYCLQRRSGRLDERHPDVEADRRSTWPRSAIGLLTRAFARRKARGLAAPTVLSCDNLPHNGRLLRQACLDFASLRSDALSTWIERHVQFPSTVVDRIVPVPSDADRYEASTRLGCRDRVSVATEPFRQWVIERFDGPRPQWEAAGGEFVSDVAPWEASKLRLLNGGHLALACLGLLADCDTVADAMAKPVLATYIRKFLLDEQQPTLPPSDHDIEAYAGQLTTRWRNPALVHRLDRIMRDSSAKLAARWLAPLKQNLAAGRPVGCTLLALAAWIVCVTRRDARAAAIVESDGQAARLRELALRRTENSADLVAAFLATPWLLGPDLAGHEQVSRRLIDGVQRLRRDGALEAAQACLSR